MRREFFISLYLFCFKVIFNFFKRKPLQDKTVFVASFGGNIEATLNQLNHMVDNHNTIVLTNENNRNRFVETSNQTILNFTPKNVKDYIKSIYHLATARYVFVDNYYGFLAVAEFDAEVKCVQLWHAAGAIKKFGLEDLSNEARTTKALERFQQVYNRFDYVTVGSDRMIDIFQNSFGLPEERFIKTGIPRTDFFFDDIKKQETQQILRSNFPLIKDRKTILYAPTYRDDELENSALEINLDKMYQHFKHDYILFLRLHPAVNHSFENKYPGFIYNVSNYADINHLLVGTDILITDYSSIPFEYSLLNRPMIFYAYDFDDYKEKRGLWNDYYTQVPGPVVETTDEIIEVIKEKNFRLERVKPFAEEWNKYSHGESSSHLIQTVYELEIETEKIREHV